MLTVPKIFQLLSVHNNIKKQIDIITLHFSTQNWSAFSNLHMFLLVIKATDHSDGPVRTQEGESQHLTLESVKKNVLQQSRY